MTYDEMANELNAEGWLVLPPEDAKQYQNVIRDAADEIERLRAAMEPLVKEILYRKPYRRTELYRLATIANQDIIKKQKT